MFVHNFKYTLKILFRNKMLIFWTFAFPIILGFFFNLAFSDIEKKEQLDIIDIAIVDNKEFKENEIWRRTFEELGDEESEKQLFDIRYVSLDEAHELLDDRKITGYLLYDGVTAQATIKENDINSTILEYVTSEIMQTEKMMQEIGTQELASDIYGQVLMIVADSEANIKDISGHNLSYTMIEYYTLIAMACLYGGILGMVAINNNLANMSCQGKRVSITPIAKGKILLGSLAASFVTQLIGVALLFIFLYYGLRVDFGDNLGLVILLSVVGCLAGLSLGIMVATVVRATENTKSGIVLSVTMLGCFLSGMMGITMKYIVDKNVPFINMINPANMITDGLYALYYYNTLGRYWGDLVSLVILSGILMIISIVVLRRQKYDSI